jgi:hypothetical protein
MTALESSTELFDLFGETALCIVCQEEAQEGERMRAIRACQHLFHARCVDPWLLSKGTCPMCRNQVLIINRTQEVVRDTSSMLRGLADTMVSEPRLNRVREQIQELLEQTNSLLQPTELQRYILTYVLSRGIRKRFGSAREFRERRLALSQQLSAFTLGGVHPLPLESDSLSAFQRSYLQIRRELVRRIGGGHTATSIRRHADVRAVHQQLVGASVSTLFLQEFWRA